MGKPALKITFVGPRDSFILVLFPGQDDPESISKIVARYAEDGYKPDQKQTKRVWVNQNGEIEQRERPLTAGLGYRLRSAFLRA